MPTTRAAAKKNVESQGGKNRRLQALFVAAFVLPQLAVWASSTDYGAYVELFELLRPVTELRMRLHYADTLCRGSNNSVRKWRVAGNWQRWLQSERFLLVRAALAFERICYTVCCHRLAASPECKVRFGVLLQGVWLFPEHFKHLVANTPLCRVSGGEPVDAVVFLFYVSKAIPPLSSPLRLPTRAGILERALYRSSSSGRS